MQLRDRYDSFYSDHHVCVIAIMVYKKRNDRDALNKSVSPLSPSQYIFRSPSSEVTLTILKGDLTSKYFIAGGEARVRLGDVLSHTTACRPS